MGFVVADNWVATDMCYTLLTIVLAVKGLICVSTLGIGRDSTHL